MSGSFETGDKVPLKGGEPVTPQGSVPNPAKLPDGQHVDHWVLSEAERAKGFIRPVRRTYKHVGVQPKNPLRDLTPEELARYGDVGYVKFEQYPEAKANGADGRYWTAAQLKPGCGTVTTQPQAIAETYARDPRFYGSTFCCGCGTYLPVGEHGEFVWDGTTERVGT